MRQKDFGTHVVRIVKKYGYLEKSVETLLYRETKLRQIVSHLEHEEVFLKSRVKSTRKELKDLSVAVNKLRKDYDTVSSRYASREKSLEKRYATDEEELKRRIYKFEQKIESLNFEVRALQQLRRGISSEIDGTRALWNFILKNKSKNLIPLAPLVAAHSANSALPLTQTTRRFFIDALVQLGMNEVALRIEDQEKYLQIKSAECRDMVRKNWEVVHKLETRAGILLKMQRCLVGEEDVMDTLNKKVLSDPRYFSMILSQPNELLVEAFASLSQQERSKLASVVSHADKAANRIAEKKFKEWINTQMKSMMKSAFNLYPVYQAPYAML